MADWKIIAGLVLLALFFLLLILAIFFGVNHIANDAVNWSLVGVGFVFLIIGLILVILWGVEKSNEAKQNKQVTTNPPNYNYQPKRPVQPSSVSDAPYWMTTSLSPARIQ